MKRNIAVLMGGFSSEKDISIKSGNVIYDNIDRESYIAYKIIISKEKWVYVDDNNVEFKVSKDDFSIEVDKIKINFDVAFIVIHGSPGEDGLLQSYFELLGVPFTGCDSYTSSITFNKRDCISILQKHDIQSAKSIHLNIGDAINENEIIAELGIPCFVKANKSGSSFGVYKVHDRKDLISSINNSFKIDNEVLIESFLDGIEVSVGVMNYKNEIKILGITQLITDNDFFDYSAKYEGKSKEITPANISELQKSNVTTISKKIYKKLGIKGFSRSEFIFIGDTPFFIEINSIPGMTNDSILPKQAENSGISLKDICSEVIEQAIN